VGRRDPVIGVLQETYRWLRPELFHSPYEAAAGFVVGHRISIRQRRALMTRMAEELGVPIEVKGQVVHAFPSPHALLRLSSFPGVSPEKIERLHGIAKAALDGFLDRARLQHPCLETPLLLTTSMPSPAYQSRLLQSRIASGARSRNEVQSACSPAGAKTRTVSRNAGVTDQRALIAHHGESLSSPAQGHQARPQRRSPIAHL
jgi:hypothetical protein